MKVEIWSDIACPFCYIGKHHFEKAVNDLPFKNDIDVEWKSFELDPSAKKDYKEDLYTLLANKYGQSRDWAVSSAEQMRKKGEDIGLMFNFDNSISTNTFDAHRLIHLAKANGLQNEVEEALFEAYFRDGKHLGRAETLVEVGTSIGLDADEIKHMLNSDRYSEAVREDEQKSREYGIRGVPYFVINSKYGISGAQPADQIKDVLTKAHEESSAQIIEDVDSGSSCDADGCN